MAIAGEVGFLVLRNRRIEDSVCSDAQAEKR
jgi:hypothetical protein